jgi:hypothetical protein
MSARLEGEGSARAERLSGGLDRPTLVVAGVAILAAARVLRPDAGRADAGALNWLGAALLCPGLAGIVFGLSETESHGGIGRSGGRVSLRR